ncbi:ankyrin repeat domain-containing protein [Chitinimonas lacunae]|uniref:Ankyrin repeat domain-containing protein n=1 Tax=Chitinimonas lacunae TaxID=1963018 RepID=A0ABV8MRV0_9NEIS
MLYDYDDELAPEPRPPRREALDSATVLARARDEDGSTALHRAVQAGEWALLPTLLRLGVEVDAVNRDGDTALHLAARQGARLSYRLLCQGGADPQRRNRRGETPEALFGWDH